MTRQLSIISESQSGCCCCCGGGVVGRKVRSPRDAQQQQHTFKIASLIMSGTERVSRCSRPCCIDLRDDATALWSRRRQRTNLCMMGETGRQRPSFGAPQQLLSSEAL